MAAPATSVETLQVAGETRNYRVHLPPTGSGPFPIVFSFHGFNSNAEQEERLSQFSALADREGFIAVYPDGMDARWRFMGRSDDDVLFTMAIIDKLAANLPVDRRRIYATGISNGAQMAWRLACDRPTVFAAFGFVSGGYFKVCGGPLRPPIILFHGTSDRLLPYDGRGMLMPVRDFAIGWAARDGCRMARRGAVIYRKGDATGERWACLPGQEVDLYTLDGKGHSWPGSNMPARITSQDVDATAAMWAFFAARPRP
ncbi:MAG TPA: PHB depolymerase family esterase [Candidatus Angelobacter sp.]|nr:PHB depolymerase family esterase [Candidatus Angelobacter sp.]